MPSSERDADVRRSCRPLTNLFFEGEQSLARFQVAFLTASLHPPLSFLRLSMASSSPSLLASLSKLKALIRNIPSSCPRAPKDGEIHRHFSTYDVPDGESLYFAVDRAWNRVFQGKENVPIGGKYGVGVVYEFFSHFAKQPLGGDSALLELRVSQFIQLVENV